MKTSEWLISIGLMVLFGVILVVTCGCQSSGFKEGDYIGQGLTATYTAPAVPGAVVSTHEDGSQTVVPLPSDKSAPAVVTPANQSPVVAVTVVPTTPGVVTSYVVTPEVQKGDQVAGSRCVTWAGLAPGTVSAQVATQKQKATHNPLPSVTVDKDGIHAAAGGGSTEVQSGRSWFQNLWTWVTDTLKGWLWWLVIAGIAVAAFFILPIFLPVLKPIFSSIMDGFHRMWDWFTGEISRLMEWIKTFHKKPPTPPAPPATGGSIVADGVINGSAA